MKLPLLPALSDPRAAIYDAVTHCVIAHIRAGRVAQSVSERAKVRR